jgi:hypothetical protein
LLLLIALSLSLPFIHAAADGTKLTKANWIFIYVCFLFIDLLSLCFSSFFSSWPLFFSGIVTEVRDEAHKLPLRPLFLVSELQETFHHAARRKKELRSSGRESDLALTLLRGWVHVHSAKTSLHHFPTTSKFSPDPINFKFFSYSKKHFDFRFYAAARFTTISFLPPKILSRLIE